MTLMLMMLLATWAAGIIVSRQSKSFYVADYAEVLDSLWKGLGFKDEVNS